MVQVVPPELLRELLPHAKEIPPEVVLARDGRHADEVVHLLVPLFVVLLICYVVFLFDDLSFVSFTCFGSYYGTFC